MRGNPPGPRAGGLSPGSIPAHAGQPPAPARCAAIFWVYPRACGATLPARQNNWPARGLSPRMRGNRPRCIGGAMRTGSIPAHAGQPVSTPAPDLPGRVYPRACGATSSNGPSRMAAAGLSPRMRGNHDDAIAFFSRHGSIPAHAGQPQKPARCAAIFWVYPRACGATRKGRRGFALPQGLSPRMRGNPVFGRFIAKQIGSIPAHAGQP